LPLWTPQGASESDVGAAYNNNPNKSDGPSNDATAIYVPVIIVGVLIVFGIVGFLYYKLRTREHAHELKAKNPYHLANYGLIDIVPISELKPYKNQESGFESSNFRLVKDSLNRRLAETNGLFPVRYITDSIRGLINDHIQKVDSKMVNQTETLLVQTEIAMALDNQSSKDAGVMAEMFWTSERSIEGIELCSILNAAIREDHPKNIVHAVVFAKGIEMRRNMDRDNFTDLTQKYPDVKATADMFPGGEFPTCLPHEDWRVSFRGGGFNDDFQNFFTVEKLYRCPGFLATSFEQHISEKFLRLQRASGLQTVLWTILLDGRGSEDHHHRCLHASFVAKSHLGGEKEFLFSPYSVFQVISTEWSSTQAEHHSIVLRAAIDNMEHPEDLPLAPWY